MELRVRREGDGSGATAARNGATVIEAVGEVDLSSVVCLRDELGRVLAPAPPTQAAETPRVIIEMSGVTFLDSSGVGALVGAFKKARSLGGELALAAPQPRVRRVLEIAGLTRALPIYATLDEALFALSPATGASTGGL